MTSSKVSLAFDILITGSNQQSLKIIKVNRESVTACVIQATGMVEFEDGLRIENQLKVRNGMEMERVLPGVD